MVVKLSPLGGAKMVIFVKKKYEKNVETWKPLFKPETDKINQYSLVFNNSINISNEINAFTY